jgi:SAM-dependent methyltransferase
VSKNRLTERSYDSFAPFYDLVMGERKDVSRAILDKIRRYVPKARSLLELGCGSGTFLKVFARHYDVTGIDLSASMVDLARKKVPGATLHVGDISSFDLGRRFDAIVCAFDTMNHLVSFEKWRSVFRHAHRHLEPRGVFIFDINTEVKLERYWSEPATATVHEDSMSVLEVIRHGRGRYRVDVRVFERERDGRYRLHEMQVPESTFPTDRVLGALAKHFRTVQLFDLERTRVTPATEELYFLCRDPL